MIPLLSFPRRKHNLDPGIVGNISVPDWFKPKFEHQNTPKLFQRCKIT